MASPLATVAPRRLEDLEDVVQSPTRDEPVVALTGPRTVGERAAQADDRIYLLPIDTIWAPLADASAPAP